MGTGGGGNRRRAQTASDQTAFTQIAWSGLLGCSVPRGFPVALGDHFDSAQRRAGEAFPGANEIDIQGVGDGHAFEFLDDAVQGAFGFGADVEALQNGLAL